MGAQTIGRKGLARLTRLTGLPVVSAWALGGTHIKELHLADGRMIYLYPNLGTQETEYNDCRMIGCLVHPRRP